MISWTPSDALSLDRGYKAQGLDRTKLHYHSPLQPWLSIWGVFWTALFILINGFEVFFKWNTANFLVACKAYLLHIIRHSL